MSERRCPHCHSPLDFQTLVFSLNPIIIRCKTCSESILVSPYIAAILVALMIGVGYATWLWLAELGFAPNQSLPGVLLTSLGLVYAYYEGLRSGIIPSSLVEADGTLPKQVSTARPISQQDANEAIGRVIPRIKTRSYLDAVRASIDNTSENPTQDLPFTQPLFGDLVLAYAIDTDEGHIALSPNTAEHFSLPSEAPGPELKAAAEKNALPSLSTIRQAQQGAIKQLSCDNHMMACGVLFPALWDQIEASEETEVVIAVLHRDHIWYVPSNNPAAIAALKAAVEQFDMDDNHALSRTLYVREEDEWVEFDE